MSAPIQSREHDVPPGVIDNEQNFLGQYNPDLPPFGSIGEDESTHGQALAFLMRIGREADEARQEFVEQAASNAKVFRWGQETRPGPLDCIANDIQTATLSITDIQTREPFAIFIRPVQTRDKAQAYWIGPPVDDYVAALTGLPLGLGMVPAVDPMTGQPMMQPTIDPMSGQPAADPMTGQVAMTPVMQPATTYEPMDEVTAWQVRKMLAQGAFPADWLFVLDDRAVADVYQTVFDLFWKESAGDDFVRDNLLKTNIYGYQGSYYSWDQANKRHVARNVSIKQLLLDPNADGTDFSLQNCPGFEVVMDIDQAKAEWPQLASVLDEYASPGTPARVDSVSEFGVASDREFQRRTVTFRIHWFRNQVVPMLEHEAVDAGLVEVGPDGGYHLVQAQEIPNEPNTAAGGQGAPAQPDVGGAEGVDPSATAGAADPLLVQGMEVAGAAPAPAQWPMTLGIRQIATLAQTGRIVQDIRCEHFDIPMLLNVCIPLPSQPFGQGLPEKLKGMQQADIRLLNAVVKYAETFANPGSMMPKSVADAVKQGMKRSHIDPTETIVAPDDMIERFGEKAVLWFQPPALPPAVPQVMQLLKERTQETGGHPEVMQGTAPSPNSSGRMVEALQAGAAGQFGFQAQWTAKMVERLANLMHYSHLWRLDLADMMEIYSRLPEALMEKVIERARRGRWDIIVDANSGTGGMTAKKLQRALSLFTAVSPTGEPAMPLRALREAANLDHEEMSLAYREELMNSAPAAPAPGQAMQGGQPGQQQQGPHGQPQSPQTSDAQGSGGANG